MSVPETIAKVALGEVGVRETRTNGGARIEEYQKATWLPVGAWPWCAAFVCWVLLNSRIAWTKTFVRPVTAGAWDFERWCKAQDYSVVLKKPHRDDIKRGDIVVLVKSHIGIATGPPNKDGIFSTVEGNTNNGGAREGDGVYAKTRHVSEIRSRIRFAA